MSQPIDFKRLADAALSAADNLLSEWLPGGRYDRSEYVALNPTRADKSLGSFRINTHSGVWADFATGDQGSDLIALYAYIYGVGQAEAARKIDERLNAGCFAPVTKIDLDGAELKGGGKNEQWEPILPVPEHALKSMTFRHSYREGAPVMTSVFKDADGRVLGAVARFVDSSGGKLDLPYTFCRNKADGSAMWRWRGWPNPRPLYGLDALAAHPALPVLVVEGEKCKNAADAAGLGFVVITWHGGAQAWSKSDWSAVRDRRVVLWPDADAQRVKLSRAEQAAGADPESKPLLPADEQPGLKAMRGVAALLAAQGCTVQLVAIPEPGEWPAGFDIADALADGGAVVNPRAVLSWQGAADWLADFRLPEAAETDALPPADVDFEAHPPAPADYGEPPDRPPHPVGRADEPPQQGGGDAGGDWQDALRWALDNVVRIDGAQKYFCKSMVAAWGKRELVARLGKRAYEVFCGHPDLQDWPKARVDLELERKKAELIAADPIFGSDFSRFVLIYGESEVIDLQKLGYRGDTGRMTTAALRNAIGKDRADVWLNSDSAKKLKVMRPDLGFFPFQPFGVSRKEDGSIHSDDEGFVKMINTYKGLPFEQSEAAARRDYKGRSLRDICFGFEFEGCRNIIEVLYSINNRDYRSFEWMLNWMAHRVRFPTSKQATALVVASPVQGAGKSLIFDKLMGRIFGRYAATLNQTAMESNFTGDYDEKMYVCYEEVSSQKARFDLAGRIKDQITSDHIRIERKGKDAEYQVNFIGFVYLSNYRSPVVVEKNDRRFFVVAPEQAISKDLGAALAADVADDDVVQEFVDLLYALPLSYEDEEGVVRSFGAHTPAYDTPAKVAMKAWSSSSHETFINEWIRGDLRLPVICARLDDFYDVYLTWVSRNREKHASKPRFSQLIDKYEGIGVKRTNNAVGSKEYYVVPPDNLMRGPGHLPERGSVSSGKYYDAHADAFNAAANASGYLHIK